MIPQPWMKAAVKPVPRAEKTWYRVEAKANERTKVYIYDEIGWFGTSAADFVGTIKDLDVDEFDLHINSPGGSVFDGLAIYQAIKDHPATVHVQIDGLAASAASFIAQAGDTVAIARNAMMMIHKAQGVGVGDDEVMDQLAAVLRKHNANIADIYSQRSGEKDKANDRTWLESMAAVTWYSSEEAVKAGLADKTTEEDTEEDPANTWDLSVFARVKTPAVQAEPVEAAGTTQDVWATVAQAFAAQKGADQ